MKRMLIPVICLSVLLACNSKKEDDKKPDGKPPVVPAATQASFNISPLKITDSTGKVTVLDIAADGKIHFDRQEIGTISDKGIITSPQGGLLAKFNADMLVDSAGKTLAKIDSAGTISNGSGAEMKWSADGRMMQGADDAGIRLVPADSKAKQAASAVWFLYTSFGPAEKAKMGKK